MVSVYADICTCPMPPTREILSDALALWIQLHTKYIHTAGDVGLSLLAPCTYILPCTLLDPNGNTLALMMVRLCLLYAPVWCPVSVRSWATHLPFGPSCTHIGLLLIAVYVLFSTCICTDDSSSLLDTCSCLMSNVREIWGIRTRDQIFTPTLKGALDENCKEMIFLNIWEKYLKTRN